MVKIARAGSLVDRIHGARAIPDPIASPDFEGLRVLRKKFSRGGLPADRTPEDDARIAAYRTIADLLRVLSEFRDRLARGDAVRLVMPEQTNERGRMRFEITIEERNG